MSMDANELIEKGDEGEELFNAWLKAEEIPYVYIKQDLNSQASLFAGNVKRPDFLILLNSIGLIAVDVENREYSETLCTYTLDKDDEIKQTIAFERVFRIPVWYAYLDSSGSTISWYWISALRTVEVAEYRTNKKLGTAFMALNRK